jgi:hypothetical protein
MTRQYRRLQRIRLRTTAQRAVPPDFMARLIRAHRECQWRGYSDVAIVHHRSCGIRRGARCDCEPEVFLTVDGQTVEIDHTGRVRKESRQ